MTPIDVDREGLPPEALPKKLDAVFITPSHHSPTAATMPMTRRLQLLELAERKDFVIVEDDYEFEMSFLEPPSPALKSLDQSNRVLYVGSFSKSMFPGLRLGYLVAPAPVIREARAPGPDASPSAGTLAADDTYFLALGHHDTIIHRMRKEYAKRHVIMANALRREGITIAGSADFGGTSFWLEGPEGLDTDLLACERQKQGVLIDPGSAFFPRDDGPCRYFRMGYSSIAADRIEEGGAHCGGDREMVS